MTAHTRTTTADDLRRWWYLTRLELALQGFPAAESREILRTLRADLADAAADVGTPRALRDLGPPRHLAARYEHERGRPVPRVLDGAVVALGLGLAVVLAWFSYALGAIDTLSTQGGGTIALSFLGLPLTARGGPDGLGLEATLTWPSAMLLLVLLAAAFAVGARLWRAVPGLSRPAPA